MRGILLHDDIATRLAGAGPARPATFPSQPCSIASQDRTLEALLVTPGGAPFHSVLILHGIGERLGDWHDAQQLLARHRIASLIFHYSGYGRSTGAITPTNLRNDTLAAYSKLRELVPNAIAPVVLGLSLGTGVAVDAAPLMQLSPSGVVLCEPFSLLRSAAFAVCDSLGLAGTALRPLARLVPDVYRTAASIASVQSPLLIVHSDADELFPVTMAHDIHHAAAANHDRSVQLVIPRGFAHNDAYLRPSLAYWQAILDFIVRNSAPDLSAQPSSSRSAKIVD